ncbi:MAG: M20/M25/M40 family metallo-hydrolase, partial [Solobacterium sp.]|nr:M20/M25/M40 family metallo-hydrolase [Solobacterium sp.]
QTIISRNVNPQEAATVSCCDIKTDGVMNTLPTNITILGDCRTYNPEVSQLIEKKMRQIVAAVCEANDCEGEVKYDRVFVPAINDPVCTQVVLDTARKLFGEEKAILAERPGSASEDFGQFAAVVPGCLFDIGIMPEDAVSFAPKHNAHYVFNDDAIMVGSEMFAQIVRERLK